jgi:hypothetical protein
MKYRPLLAIISVLAVIFIVPFTLYSLFSLVTGTQPPAEGSVPAFLLGILVSKAGTAIVFVLLFRMAYSTFKDHWLLYGILWFIMFSIGEIGQAIGSGYTWPEAVAGIVSEAIYCPVSAFITCRLLRTEAQTENA